MKRPGAIVYLFGNPFSGLALFGATIFFGYRWWIGEASPYLAFGFFFATAYASKASDQLNSYRLWKREWNAMGGSAALDRLFARAHSLRMVVGFALWGAFAYGVYLVSADPAARIPVALFVLGTAILVTSGIYRLVKRRRSHAKPFRDVPVAVCLPVPQHSSTIGQAFSALPAYCMQTLAS